MAFAADLGAGPGGDWLALPEIRHKMGLFLRRTAG